jgi:hypothetical protein
MGFKLALSFCLVFVKNAWGALHTPYETYRALASGKHPLQLIPLFLVVGSYFGWSALVHNGIFVHPFLLTWSFGKLSIAVLATQVFIVALFYVLGKRVGGQGSVLSVLMPWSYSLIPTVIWFYSISILWLLFPPPRTISIQGQVLSLVVIMMSLFVFYWKIILYYLTLRFGMKLNMQQIVKASLIIIPLGIFYSWGMYRLGIFRIPFF